jgi:hypothetical protein
MNTQTLDCLSIEGYSLFQRVAFFIDKKKDSTEVGTIRRMYSQIIDDTELQQRAVIETNNNVVHDVPVGFIFCDT